MTEEAVYTLEGRCAVPSAHAAGPWDETMQHGAAPSGLLAHVLEIMPTPVPMQPVRLTVELLRPVPIVPLDIETQVVREGRKIQVAMASLYNNGTEVARATAMRVRIADVGLPPDYPLPALSHPLPDFSSPSGVRGRTTGFNKSLQRHAGPRELAGPLSGSIWFRQPRPLIAGVPTSPFMRAAMTGDYTNGIGKVIDTRVWTFLNSDNTLYLARLPVGEWILLEGRQWYGPQGAGFASMRMGDALGFFGEVTSTLVLERRPKPLGVSVE